MKLLSWNIENLAPYVGAAGAAVAGASTAATPLAAYVELMGSPDVVCLQEVRVRPQDTALVDAMNVAVPGYVCHASLARDPRNVTFRGGRMYGVATYVSDRLARRTKPRAWVPDWDREGRVVITELTAAKVAIAIVNVYAVNGTSKPYWDHDLGRIDGDRHRWKRRFVERVADEASALRDRGFHLVLVGDWNVSRTAKDTHPRLRTEEPHATARALFNDVFMPRLDVVDAFRELHPEARKYTWFNRRARALDAARVDLALVSRALLPAVDAADIDESPEARLASDHAPLTLHIAVER